MKKFLKNVVRKIEEIISDTLVYIYIYVYDKIL
jgi:hypothetical protein